MKIAKTWFERYLCPSKLRREGRDNYGLTINDNKNKVLVIVVLNLRPIEGPVMEGS